MNKEELDLEIEKLLEERPNEEKEPRRRRNKQKDRLKEARRGLFNIPEKVVRGLVGDKEIQELKYVKVTYFKHHLYVGYIEGWYDRIKEISEALSIHPDEIKLEHLGDKKSSVWVDIYDPIAYFFNENGERVAIRRFHSFSSELNENILLENLPLPKGLYEYTDEIKNILDGLIPNLPNKTFQNKFAYKDYHYSNYELFKNHHGEYENYRQAIIERENSNIFQKTFPIKKGNEIGKRNELIKYVNNNPIEKIDDKVMEYEEAAKHYEYEYYW